MDYRWYSSIGGGAEAMEGDERLAESGAVDCGSKRLKIGLNSIR